ncbi:MAG: hypothetical protein JNJ57_19590 [Saprospiraceae bacterium]|nr:hypothetical protein [Saprospiraceae bacterium]
MPASSHPFRQYLSLILLFAPALGLVLFLGLFGSHPRLQLGGPLWFPWQFWLMGLAGIIATIGGVLDWRFHRDPLKLQLSKKERDAEAAALGLGGVPMFLLMCSATLSEQPNQWLIPILVVLIYTVVAICYDEFVFHLRRCGKTETMFHRMLVFGNGTAWLAWMHFIYYR